MSLVGKPFSLQLGDFFLFTFFIAISSFSPPAEPGVHFAKAKESRPPEQTIPEAGFFLSVGSAVVKNNLQFLIAQKSCKKRRKTAYFRRNKLFSGAAGRIRTADLILTNCSKAPKVLLSSAFGVFLFQRCVAFGAFRSMCSIRSFPRVGHGVGQAENTGRISCRMPVFSSCRFAQVTRVTSSTKWRSFFAK